MLIICSECRQLRVHHANGLCRDDFEKLANREMRDEREADKAVDAVHEGRRVRTTDALMS